ncbi:Transmembrane protein 97 [Bulinus truncatus]|nr:Transmembrane protein 97 [Bulinus truncatus]
MSGQSAQPAQPAQPAQKTGPATKNLEKIFPRHRLMDYVICGYFVFQVPSTLLFDTQAVYTESLYPSALKSVRSYYLEAYKDPFFADAWKHPWYLSMCLVENFIEVPFYFWAAWNFCIHGALKKPLVIVPSMLYAIHTLTAILAIWFMAIGADFSLGAEYQLRESQAVLRLLPFLHHGFRHFVSLVETYDK